jgi:hypothetical protein
VYLFTIIKIFTLRRLRQEVHFSAGVRGQLGNIVRSHLKTTKQTPSFPLPKCEIEFSLINIYLIDTPKWKKIGDKVNIIL